MASTIRIKRSTTAGNPNTLGAGELAYSALADNGSNGGDRLYIGIGTETNGNAANHIVIGGKVFTDRLDHTPGTLTASSALIVDSNSKIDTLLTTNLQLGGAGYDNYIRSTNTDGNIIISPNGAGYVQISGTNALVIPKGTSAQQAPAVAGAIRFNTDNTSYEGYDGTNWASLGGVRSTDQLTYIAALGGMDNGSIVFNAKDGTSSVEVARLDKTGINIEATTATTSDGTTGALRVAGGVSIQGNLYVDGALYGIDNITSNGYVAAQGVPNNGATGYSFQNDGGYDTGMFSTSDGVLSLYSNNNEIIHIDGTQSATLHTDTLLFGNGGYNNEGSAAQIAWNGGDDAIKFNTWGYPDNAIRATPVAAGQGFLIQTSNATTGGTEGRSSLRWHDIEVSAYSQVDAQYDGVWIKNAAWSGSGFSQYWHYGLDGKLAFPNVNTSYSGVSYSKLWAQNNNEFIINPDTDNDASRLHIASWFHNQNINIYNDGGQGLTLGNADNGDSSIDIGGSNGSWYDSPDDIAIYAKRNGILHLRTNNGDIVQQNDSGSVTFRNSDGHLVVPNVIETYDSTGDVILAASDGTERNAVFKGDGYFSLPNAGIQFYDSNNISGTKIAEMGFDGELYISNYNDQVGIWANDNAHWQFNNNQGGTLILPHGAILSDGSSNSILLGNGVDPTGYSQRISIGYQPDTQDGQSWDTIAIGARAGTSNQGNNAIAMGNRAGNTNQGADAIAIGSSPNSSVGGAGYSNQGNYSVAIGAQAGEISQGSESVALGYQAGQNSQSNNAVALGYYAGNNSQGFKSVAIGDNAGQSSQGYLSVAIGAHAGDTSQGHSSVALGHTAGRNSQGTDAVAIGVAAGQTSQGNYAVAIGERAGYGNDGTQGEYAIAIGSRAGYDYQQANSIILNASGGTLNSSEAGLFIDPIRNVIGSQYLTYNSDTKEVTYQTSTLQISGDTLSATNTDGNIIIEPNGAGHISASNAQIKNVAEPTDDTDAATKYYVDAARSGLDVKQSVRLATTADITLSGPQTIDTKVTANGDRVLVKDQNNAVDNGIYVASDSGAWARATDFDTNAEVTSGAFTFVEDGSVNLNAGFVVTTKTVNVGTTPINWTLFSASGTLIAGDGLSKSGYTLAVNVDADGGIEINSDSLRLKSSLAGDGLTYSTGVLSVGGTSDRISVNSNSIDIASTYVGQTSITTLGTITSGTWNANIIDSAYGGTGFSTYSKGDIIYASATNTLSKLSGGDSGKVLQMNDAGVPVWGDIDGGTY